MSSEVLQEEFEVLESIYTSELSKISDKEIRIKAEPEDSPEDQALKVTLHVQYPDDYPDVLPDLSIECTEGEIDDTETKGLLEDLRRMGEDSLGMAMTFTLVTHLRERLSDIVRTRKEIVKQAELEKERIALEEEATRTRGTPVTVASFKAWKAKFDAERAEIGAREEVEKLKGMTPKEREEWKRAIARLSGRQLFERNKNLEEENLMEEGTVSVDISQYERRHQEEQDEEERIAFSDSD
ncbi:hypothetical protein E1B28_008791 [Marasmius oreades]|uniref:RWD domain-containing protein n=1 Tax=Marasmius oreades TaxID=181124 RepID=A0A9P7USQ8_9AGAR|nr:uncharacterized protein E1B28_008791 [Marasmius oreades]KAG7092435.1 hypothetical protein E1B28_008791 [Marasmius oreades]